MFTLYRMRDERNALEKLTSFVSSVLIFSFVPLMHVHANLSTFLPHSEGAFHINL